MGSIVFCLSSVPNSQDSMTHLISFLSITINGSKKRFGVDIVDGDP